MDVPADIQVLGIYRISSVLDRTPRSVKRLIKDGKLKAWRNGGRWETTEENIRNYLRKLQKGPK